MHPTLLHLVVLLPSIVFCSPHSHSGTQTRSTRTLQPRNIVYDGVIAQSYDFVIVGGGLAGLVLASRLSEDESTTVLVLEAGDTGDAVADTINHPGNTYWSSLRSTSYDWAFNTAPQSGLSNRGISWPRGKVLGGSSAVNGLYMIRPSGGEINAWESLIAPDDSAAASKWGWENFLATMKMTETFAAPKSDVQSMAHINYDASSHGSGGPVYSSYPGYMFDLVGQWLPTLQTIGIGATNDAYGGNNLGAFIANSAINPTNWTRSYSRSAYIDPLPPRSNLQILPNATVTRLIFDTSNAASITATGVEFATSASNPKTIVHVNKEVILAGGAIGSPHVLLLSGVGPRNVIESVGLTVVNELPGVGQHLQDHLVGAVVFNTSAETAGSLKASGSDVTTTAEFLSYVNSATAYLNSTALLGADAVASLSANLTSSLQSSTSTLVPSEYTQVIEGYKAIYGAVANMFTGQVGQVELLQSITGNGIVMVQAAIQHPLSQGHIYINSSSVFDPPVIDPGYLSHPLDIVILREGFKLARKIGQSSPLSDSLTGEVTPGSSVVTDADWETWIRSNVGTEFHPTGSCAMLPLAQGGVVNAKLQVYGTANVRVADASVIPFTLSAHLMTSTYAIAEIASGIIREQYSPKSSSPASPVVTPTQHKSAAKSLFPTTISLSLLAYFVAVTGAILVM